MKKLIALMMVLMLVFSLAACTAEEAAPAEGAPAEAAAEGPVKPEGEIVVGGAASYTGNYYIDGSAFAEAFNRSGASASVILSGGTANIIAVGDGTMKIGPTGAISLLDSYAGTNEVYPRVYDDVVVLFAMDMFTNYFIVPADSPIQSVADLKGKTVVTGEISSTSYVCFEDYLKAYGMTADDLGEVRTASMGEGKDMIADKLVDAFFMNSGVPNATILEMCTSCDVRIIPVDAEHQEAILACSEAYQPYVLPAGTYKGQDEDIAMVGFKNLVIVNKATPDGEVIWMLDSILENWDYIKTACTWLSDLTLEDVANCGNFELHPAAKAYFEAKIG